MFQGSAEDSFSPKRKLQTALDKAVLEKRYKDAGIIQNDLENIEKLQMDLKVALQQRRYQDAADIEVKIKKVSSDLNDMKDPAQSVESQFTLNASSSPKRKLQSALDKAVLEQRYKDTGIIQIDLDNIENLQMDLKVALEQRRYQDAADIEVKIKKVSSDLNDMKDSAQSVESQLTLSNLSSTKRKLKTDLDKTVLEKRYKDAGIMQDIIKTITTFEKLQMDLNVAIDQRRYQDAPDIEVKIEKVSFDFNDMKDQVQSGESQFTLNASSSPKRKLQTELDKAVLAKQYKDADIIQIDLDNIEKLIMDLKVALEQRRYQDAADIEVKIKKVSSNLNEMKDPAQSVDSQFTLNGSSLPKRKLQAAPDKAVLEQRYKNAGIIQINLDNIEKLQMDLKVAMEQRRYQDAADLEVKIKKVLSDLNDIKDPAQSVDSQLTLNESSSPERKLQTALDKAVLEQRYKDSDIIQIHLDNIEKLQMHLKVALEQRRYQDVADIEVKTKKICYDLNDMKDPAQLGIFACIIPKKQNGKITGYECSFVDEQLGFPCNAKGRLLNNMKNHMKDVHS